MQWLAENWDSIITILNSIGFLFLSRKKSV